MRSTADIIERLEALKGRNAARDRRHADVMAIRDGDYGRVAGDLLPDDFDKPLVANLIDTAARDISEVMAPLPSIQCAISTMATDKAKKFAETRGRIANSYVQRSSLQTQMFDGADRYGTFGFMAYVVEPDFDDNAPVIRVDDTPHAYYVRDFRGRICEYYTVSYVPVSDLCHKFPEKAEQIRNLLGRNSAEDVELVTYRDYYCYAAILPAFSMELKNVPNLIARCPVAIVQRPTITNSVHGQFDDVIFVQVARAMVQTYMMSALDQSVNAPMVVPDDINEMELGPLSVIQTNNPGGVGRVRLDIPQGVFPSSDILSQEQRVGSRYPEGRSGSIDASIVTGQGVQALMGTFDTQIQTFQRLNAAALEDVLSMCFEMDQKVFDVEKTIRIKDSGSPYEVTYKPSKDIAGDYTCDVSYGAIAGLDPNRALVFILQTLAAGMFSKETARKYLPVELDASAEEKQIDMEQFRDSLSASVAALSQAVPMMASQGQDPRQIVQQIADVMKLRAKGKSIEDAVTQVFAPKQEEAAAPADPLAAMMQQAQGGGGAPAPQSPGQDLLMSLAGMTPGGGANLQSNVSRRTPI